MKSALIFLFVFMASTANACFSPIKGEEYDSLLELKRLNKKNHYQITVPQHIDEEREAAQIILAYSKNGSGGIPIYGKNEILETTLVKGKFLAKFEVSKQEKQPYIVVMWWHKMDGMCGIQANSQYLEVE
jgi:hypothetical protein